MKKYSFLLLCALLFCGGIAAQRVTISPVPQHVKWGKVAFSNTTSFRLVGIEYADADAVALLKKHLTIDNKGITFLVGECGDAVVKKYARKVPTQTEGYYLKVTPSQVVIAGRDEAGTFYGVQSFLQLLKSKEVMCVEIKDYPSTPLRGVIEGFYGNPWSTRDRERQFLFYGQNKMNTYVYGPKDDPYHRPKWREPYPETEGRLITHLAACAHKNKVNFVWAVHPGVDIKWNQTDRDNIVRKLESVYRLGVRAFAVFFDDISGEGTDANKQAELLNYITDNFVRKHTDVQPLIMCPTEYNRGWAGKTYLPTLGKKMYPEVRIMWTGNTVVDMINKSDMDWINERIQRNAFIWLNYPVSDFCISHLLMGKTYGNDLDIASQVSAFCSNPMEYAEASKVSLYSIADYTWNMPAYDAETSWQRAIGAIMPTCTEDFRVFCENNVDLGANTHNMRRENESPRFAAAQQRFDAAMAKRYDAEALQQMTLQFDTLCLAAQHLLANAVNEPEMIGEIAPWLQVMRLIGERGKLTMQLHTDLYQHHPEAFLEHYKNIVALQEEEDTIMSRNFPGSIKAAHPIVASMVVTPFLKAQLFDLIQRYKKSYNEGWECFPTVALENGIYLIRCNGKYLTDAHASATATGDYPIWQTMPDTINPQRQQWTVQLNAATGRYKIANTQDGRYINELGNFWKSATGNPFDPEWHTYVIYKSQQRYAIQNSGAAGTAFWTTTDTRIKPSSSHGAATPNDYIFEFIPVK